MGGIGEILTAVLAIVYFGEATSVLKILPLVPAARGTDGLNLSGGSP